MTGEHIHFSQALVHICQTLSQYRVVHMYDTICMIRREMSGNEILAI